MARLMWGLILSYLIETGGCVICLVQTNANSSVHCISSIEDIVKDLSALQQLFENAGCESFAQGAPHGLWPDIWSVSSHSNYTGAPELIHCQLANASWQQSGKDHSTLWF